MKYLKILLGLVLAGLIFFNITSVAVSSFKNVFFFFAEPVLSFANVSNSSEHDSLDWDKSLT